ncbi:MAG: DUF3109 family protein [Prevotella sp.]|nr:DUF3109 family protein [Prevotella sp.]
MIEQNELKNKEITPLPSREGSGVGLLPILQIGDVLLSPDILTERFCCDYEKCKGVCCVEGNAGAPVTIDEIGEIEESLDAVWGDLSAQAQSVLDRQGVAYPDPEGELVTSIVNGRECVFARSLSPNPSPKGEGNNLCWKCLLEKAFREGKTKFLKPISCSLYPIREKRFSNGTVGLNYNRWDICRDAVKKGQELNLPVYRFLEEPLVRRFGREWYNELCEVAKELSSELLNSSNS